MSTLGNAATANELLHLGVLMRRRSLDARAVLARLDTDPLGQYLAGHVVAMQEALSRLDFETAEGFYAPLQGWSLETYRPEWMPTEIVSQRPRILMVEDSPFDVELLARVVPDAEILIAHNGLEGLRLASWETPDLILIDVGLPDISGWDVLRLLRDEPRTKRALTIFLTGAASEDDEARGLEGGAIDYIAKPFHPAIVRSRILNHLELKKHRDFFEQLAHLDGLTSLANRRRFDTHLEAEWSRAARIRSPIALVMGDLDKFKLYNDRYGHLSGDDLLRRASQSFLAVPHRPADLLARYGGEEFACILPDTGTAGALLVADRMRRSLERLAIAHEGNPHGIATVSFGVASIQPLPDQPMDALIAEADRWLYEAKRQGGNITASAGSSGSDTTAIHKLLLED
jgi:diguanylate cyclase (GGDEF)-like protein